MTKYLVVAFFMFGAQSLMAQIVDTPIVKPSIVCGNETDSFAINTQLKRVWVGNRGSAVGKELNVEKFKKTSCANCYDIRVSGSTAYEIVTYQLQIALSPRSNEALQVQIVASANTTPQILKWSWPCWLPKP
jgi:hypothetical protein